jgi:hypothetical protein
MKPASFLKLTLALNLALGIAVMLVPRAKPSAPRDAVAARPQAKSPEVPPATTNFTASVIPFHWRQVESEDYRRYIANLRGLGCPERLIRDIILADITELYERKERDIEPPAMEAWAWFGADRREELTTTRAYARTP